MCEDRVASCNIFVTAAATAFRLGMEADASENLVSFVDSFAAVLQEGKGIDMQLVNALLAEVLAAQARKDYLRVADILEYEIASLLSHKIVKEFK